MKTKEDKDEEEGKWAGGRKKRKGPEEREGGREP